MAFHGPCLFSLLATQKGISETDSSHVVPRRGKTTFVNFCKWSHGSLITAAWFYRDQFEPIGWPFLLESAEKIHWHPWQVSHEHFLSISKLNRSKVRLTINVHASRGSRFLLWQTRCHWGWTGVGDTDMWPVTALQCSHLFPLYLMIWHHERIRYANVYGLHCSYTTRFLRSSVQLETYHQLNLSMETNFGKAPCLGKLLWAHMSSPNEKNKKLISTWDKLPTAGLIPDVFVELKSRQSLALWPQIMVGGVAPHAGAAPATVVGLARRSQAERSSQELMCMKHMKQISEQRMLNCRAKKAFKFLQEVSNVSNVFWFHSQKKLGQDVLL